MKTTSERLEENNSHDRDHLSLALIHKADIYNRQIRMIGKALATGEDTSEKAAELNQRARRMINRRREVFGKIVEKLHDRGMYTLMGERVTVEWLMGR